MAEGGIMMQLVSAAQSSPQAFFLGLAIGGAGIFIQQKLSNRNQNQFSM